MTTFAAPDMTTALMQVQTHQQAAKMPAATHVSDADKATLRHKAREFESFFLYQTLDLMKSGVEGEFTGGYAEETFRHTLNEHIAQSVTDAGGVGISDMIYGELLKNQEARNASLAAAKAASNAYRAAP